MAPMVGTLTTALIYTRVSREEQAKDGISLDAQLAESRRYAARQGWVLGTEYQDVMTGTRDDRPQYQALLAEVRRLRGEGQAVAVVVAALDRLGRKLLERVRARDELKAMGVATHSVREGGEVSDLVSNILASVAQEESRRLGERVRAVRTHMISNGWHPVGRAPWGYLWRDATEEERAQGAPKKVLDLDEAAAPYVRETFARVADSGEAVRQVTRWLMHLPPSARAGRALGIFALRHVVRATVYVGRPEMPGVEVFHRPQGRWPALVDPDTWQRAQERLDLHRRIPRQASGAYLLTGFIRCSDPRCGARMQGYSSGPNGRTKRRYRCQSERQGASAAVVACPATVMVSAVDDAVVDRVSSVMAVLTAIDPEMMPMVRKEWRALEHPPQAADAQRRVRQAEADAEQARARIRRATDLYVDEKIGKNGYDDKCERERAVIVQADAERLRWLDAKPARPLPLLDVALRRAGGWDKALRAFDVPAQRTVLAELVSAVRAYRVGIGKYRVEVDWTPEGEVLRDAADTLRGAPTRV